MVEIFGGKTRREITRLTIDIGYPQKKLNANFKKGRKEKGKKRGEKRKERKEKREKSETQARDEWHWLRYYADAFVVSVPAIQERTCTCLWSRFLGSNKVRTCARGLAVTSPCTGNYHPPGNFSGSLVLHQPDLD